MKKVICLAAVFGLLLVGLVPAAGADPAARPLAGALTGTVSFVPDAGCPFPPALRTESEGTGAVSHLGLTTMTSVHCSGTAFAGTMAWVAANGDEVWLEYAGTGPIPTEPGEVYEVDAEFEVVGGTGRFEDAVGGGEMDAAFVFLPDQPAWPTTWEIVGTIGY